MNSSSDVPILIKEGQLLLKKGDEEGAHCKFLEAGRELYDRHRGAMLARCTWRVGDVGKDLVQEAFQLLWEKMPMLEHPETVQGWLYGVLDNKMKQMYDKTRNRDRIREEKQTSIAGIVHASKAEPPEGVVLEMEEDQQGQETLKRLSRTLKKLDPDDVTILRMRFHLDISLSEIGLAIGVSEATVRRRISRILKSLRKKLQNERRVS